MIELPATQALLPATGIILVAYLVILVPASKLIRRVLMQWIAQLPQASNPLVKAGAMIGYLERVLMLTF